MAIVVGVDSSEESLQALRWAVKECRLRGTSLRAVHAWQIPFVPDSYDPYFAGPVYSVPPIDPAEMRRLAESQLARAVSTVETDDLEIEQLSVEGHPAEALLQAAEDAELLVVGSRGHGGFTGLLLGSISQACVHHARCPVVIIRGERRGPAPDGPGARELV